MRHWKNIVKRRIELLRHLLRHETMLKTIIIEGKTKGQSCRGRS